VEAALIEEGADDYLEKPLDPRLFLARVSATLRRTAAGSG
jgi:DNA-binding response OmpR family regulator